LEEAFDKALEKSARHNAGTKPGYPNLREAAPAAFVISWARVSHWFLISR